MTNTQPPDRPQVQIELDAAFGGKRQQQVNVQSNRTDPTEQFRWSWLNTLYPAPSVVDISIDAVTYALTSALAAVLLVQSWDYLSKVLVGVLVWMLISMLVVTSWFVCRFVQNGWLLLVYRGLLVAAGVVVGGWL